MQSPRASRPRALFVSERDAEGARAHGYTAGRMSDSARNLVLGVFCAVAVVLALRIIDLVQSFISFVLVRVGVLPGSSLAASVAIVSALAVAAITAKALALFVLARRPEKLTWLARSWTWPIVLAVLTFVAVPVHAVLHWMQTVALLTNTRDLPVGELANWSLANNYVGMGAQIANAGIWAAVVLIAFARLRSAMAPAPDQYPGGGGSDGATFGS